MWYTTSVQTPANDAPAFVIVERDQPYADATATTSGWTGVNKNTAWQRARSQHLTVKLVKINGETVEIGDAFHAPTFEHAAHSGYVSYGLSMTDGVFHPLQFEQWVKLFRKNVLAPASSARLVWSENDTPEYVKDALHRYATELQRVTR